MNLRLKSIINNVAKIAKDRNPDLLFWIHYYNLNKSQIILCLKAAKHLRKMGHRVTFTKCYTMKEFGFRFKPKK